MQKQKSKKGEDDQGGRSARDHVKIETAASKLQLIRIQPAAVRVYFGRGGARPRARFAEVAALRGSHN